MVAVLASRLHSATRIVLHSRRYLSLVFISLVLLISLLSSHHHQLRPLSVHSLSLSSFRTRLSSVFFQPKGQTVPELQQQAYALSGNRTRPTCPWQRFHSRRYRALALEPRNVFVAMNFWNNAEVLPTFFQEFPKIVEVLGRSRVFVSVYENGSEDGTAEMLQLFGDMLSRMGVAHRVVARGKAEYTYKDGGHRISALASIRNAAMDPLYTGDAARALGGAVAFDDVLWVNDVHHCAADLLEVVYQKRLQGANQACGVDWAGWGDHVIYDRWVLRTITGRVFYLREELLRWVYPADDDPRQPDNRGPLPRLLPYADSQADKARFESNLPIQVFSCWNGVTAIDASAFLPPNNLRFRVAKADLDEEGKPREATELISECFLSSVDLWSMGKGRIVLAPRASVAYNWWNYDEHRKDQIPLHPHLGDEIIKDWVVDPPATVAFQDNAKWDEPERWGPWNEQ